MDVVAQNELLFRLGSFAAIFGALVLLERLWPRRTAKTKTARRWLTNLGIVAVDSLLVRVMALAAIPLAVVAAAAWTSAQELGLLHWVSAPVWLETAIAIVALDLAIWFQHWLTHKVPILWRLHRVHHVDPDFDVTTAVRFHPIEIGLSVLYKIGVVIALGPSVIAVILFEVILNGCAMFNHANLRLPVALDRWLRLLVVTPDVHRVHHSIHHDEHNSNFGFSVTTWDRLFRTYRAQPRAAHAKMDIGLPGHVADAQPTKLGWSLLYPFRRR